MWIKICFVYVFLLSQLNGLVKSDDDSPADDYIASAVEDEGQIKEKKVTGYFLPPQTGDYKFFSKCAGECDVFLGDGKDLLRERIISVDGKDNKGGEKASHLIYLTKGKSYFLQASTRGSVSTNETKASVGVVLPNDNRIFPISPEYLDNVVVEEGVGAKRTANASSSTNSVIKNAKYKVTLVPTVSKSKLKNRSNKKKLLKKLEQVGKFIKSMERSNHREERLDGNVNDILKSLEFNVKHFNQTASQREEINDESDVKNHKSSPNHKKPTAQIIKDVSPSGRSNIDQNQPSSSDMSPQKEKLVIHLIDQLKRGILGEDRERRIRDRFYQKQFQTLFQEVNELKHELKENRNRDETYGQPDFENSHLMDNINEINEFNNKVFLSKHRSGSKRHKTNRQQQHMDFNNLHKKYLDEDIDDLHDDNDDRNTEMFKKVPNKDNNKSNSNEDTKTFDRNTDKENMRNNESGETTENNSHVNNQKYIGNYEEDDENDENKPNFDHAEDSDELEKELYKNIDNSKFRKHRKSKNKHFNSMAPASSKQQENEKFEKNSNSLHSHESRMHQDQDDGVKSENEQNYKGEYKTRKLQHQNHSHQGSQIVPNETNKNSFERSKQGSLEQFQEANNDKELLENNENMSTDNNKLTNESSLEQFQEANNDKELLENNKNMSTDNNKLTNESRKFDPITGNLKVYENSEKNNGSKGEEFHDSNDKSSSEQTSAKGIETDDAYLRLHNQNNNTNEPANDSYQNEKNEKNTTIDINNDKGRNVLNVKAGDFKVLEDTLFHAFEARLKSGDFPGNSESQHNTEESTHSKTNSTVRSGNTREYKTMKKELENTVIAPVLSTKAIANRLENDMKIAYAENVDAGDSNTFHSLIKSKQTDLALPKIQDNHQITSINPMITEAVQAPLIRENQGEQTYNEPYTNTPQQVEISSPTQRMVANQIPTSIQNTQKSSLYNKLNRNPMSVEAVGKPFYATLTKPEELLSRLPQQLPFNNVLQTNQENQYPSMYARKGMLYYHFQNKVNDSSKNEIAKGESTTDIGTLNLQSITPHTQPSGIESPSQVTIAAKTTTGDSFKNVFKNTAEDESPSGTSTVSDKDSTKLLPAIGSEGEENEIKLSDDQFQQMTNKPIPVEYFHGHRKFENDNYIPKVSQTENSFVRGANIIDNLSVDKPLESNTDVNSRLMIDKESTGQISLNDISTQGTYLSKIRTLLNEVNHLKGRILSMKRDKVLTASIQEQEETLQELLLQKEKLLSQLKSSRKSTVITPRSRKAS